MKRPITTSGGRVKSNTPFFFSQAVIGPKIGVASLNFRGFEKWPIGEHHFPRETKCPFIYYYSAHTVQCCTVQLSLSSPPSPLMFFMHAYGGKVKLLQAPHILCVCSATHHN
jgi:hypothetical protein